MLMSALGLLKEGTLDVVDSHRGRPPILLHHHVKRARQRIATTPPVDHDCAVKRAGIHSGHSESAALQRNTRIQEGICRAGQMIHLLQYAVLHWISVISSSVEISGGTVDLTVFPA